MSEPERSVEDCFFCDHGHHYEDEARLVAEFFLGCVAFTTGLWIHPMFPYAHASPDGLLVYAATALTWISACFAADALTGLMEIKSVQTRCEYMGLKRVPLLGARFTEHT